ncbi:hypothetical protein BGX26_001400 [Mortierella sp. AD094]|nr:hypothetical protein BGX26_001400 [Mortierella sp. AD094]
MKLSPTSITLFLVQIATFFSGLIVAICCGLYVSAYPKSPDAGKLSAVACGTLAFSILSTLVTAVLILRQKSGKTLRVIIESAWVIFATAMWVLASIGGIAFPPNGMTNISCKVLPSGDYTTDPNYIRACQSAFASTAFCIVTALFFIAIALMLFVFSVKRSIYDRKNRKNQVGGHYKLSMTPSQYRRAEKEAEEGKNLKGAGEHEEEEEEDSSRTTKGTGAHRGDGSITDGRFLGNVYRDPVITVITTLPATLSAPSSNRNPYSATEFDLQQQQLQQQQQHNQYQYQQQQSSWNQQPAYAPCCLETFGATPKPLELEVVSSVGRSQDCISIATNEPPNNCLTALPATFPPKDLPAVKSLLSFQSNIRVINFGHDRANIKHIVSQLQHPERIFQDLKFLKKTIVYFQHIENTQKALEYLQRHLADQNDGSKIAVYHSVNSDDFKKQMLDAFREDKVILLLATSDVGMGHDIKNTHRVVQYGYP